MMHTKILKTVKVLIAFMMFLFILTGCNTQSKEETPHQYGYNPPIEGLYWGISLEDIESVLSIQDGVNHITYNDLNPGTQIILPDKIQQFGYNATVYIEVEDAIEEEWFPFHTNYLSKVKLIYEGIDQDKLKENMQEELGGKGYNWVDVREILYTTWNSEDTIKSIDQESKSKLREYWRLLDKYRPIDDFFRKKKNEESINSITLMKTEEGNAMVTYLGGNAIILNKLRDATFIDNKKETILK